MIIVRGVNLYPSAIDNLIRSLVEIGEYEVTIQRVDGLDDALQVEELRDAGQTVKLHVLGLATIGNDVSPELALATIASVEVLGAFRAPMAVKAALANRTAT